MLLTRQQREAIDKLELSKVAALFMEPGTGKTLTVYNLIGKTDTDYVLYLAPLRTIKSDNYEESVVANIGKCGGFSVPCDFVGLETLSMSDRAYSEVTSRLKRFKKATIVCDESLKIKNVGALRTRRLLELAKYSEYRYVLNGTPLSKSLLDLWSQMEFLSPLILDMGYIEFKNTFLEYTTVRKQIGDYVSNEEWVNRYHNVEHLYSLISPYIYECNLEVGSTQHIVDIDYVVGESERSQYKEIKEKYLKYIMLEYFGNNIFLRMTQELQQSYSLSPSKFALTQELINNHSEDKTLIVVKYRKTYEQVKSAFPRAKVLSYGRHSYGLNLQQYDTMIIWDKTFDYAQLEQMMHRIYRMGQESERCTYYNLTGDLPLDKLIDNNINRKIKLLDSFKNYAADSIEEIF